MKSYFIRVVCCLFPCILMGQNFVEISELDQEVSETSGLIYFDEHLITHNDSGGLNSLYVLDEKTGEVVRTVVVENANNRDWEDLAQDSDYIYIGDFGNQNGDRSDLKVYKISKKSFLASDQVEAEIIEFNYSDQEGLVRDPQNTNYDAEALIALNDALYIFTKNWIDTKTNVYKLSKEPGKYSLERIDQIDVEGLITGATINKSQHKVVLSGYETINAFAVELRGFSQGKFSNGVVDKYTLNLPFNQSYQIESIAFMEDFNYYLSSEKNRLGEATLYLLTSTTLGLSTIEASTYRVFPNPASTMIQIQHDEPLIAIQIYNLLGQVMYEDYSRSNQIELDQFERGVYVMKVVSERGSQSIKFLKE
ncbi:T9SS type A sorting domain-containing protein [Lutimonas sp.]|uniref:T9SS type A sorting domain-containing protein n=1 Tax=Lutimonas sp. TaxID=1872403 RepID=UPI003D9BB045